MDFYNKFHGLPVKAKLIIYSPAVRYVTFIAFVFYICLRFLNSHITAVVKHILCVKRYDTVLANGYQKEWLLLCRQSQNNRWNLKDICQRLLYFLNV